MRATRWTGRVLAVVALALSPGSIVAASAHSYLRSSDPADGAVLAESPQQVVLTFSDPLVPGTAAVTVAGAVSGRLPHEVQGSRITATWPQDAGGGRYRIGYRVASQDGHIMEGSVAFRVKGPAAETAATPAQGAPDPTPSPAPNGTDAATTPAAVPPWVWVVGALSIAAAAVVAFSARRRT